MTPRPSNTEAEGRVELMPLIDAPYDGYCEEWGWFPRPWAETPEEAVTRFAEAIPLEDPDLRYALATGEPTEWMRPTGVPVEGEDLMWKGEDLLWKDESGHLVEFCPWDSCGADHPDAIEFWRIEVIDASPTKGANHDR